MLLFYWFLAQGLRYGQYLKQILTQSLTLRSGLGVSFNSLIFIPVNLPPIIGQSDAQLTFGGSFIANTRAWFYQNFEVSKIGPWVLFFGGHHIQNLKAADQRKGSEEELIQFVEYLNSYHPTITFKCKKDVNFSFTSRKVDTTIWIDE